jgi:PAS domain S-box-containing protein
MRTNYEVGGSPLNEHRILVLLNKAADDLISSNEPKKLLDSLFQRLSEYLDLNVYFTYFIDETVNKIKLMHYHGISEEEASKIEWLNIGEAVCGIVARDKKPIIVENVHLSENSIVSMPRKFGVKTYACHPLISFGKLIGTLSFGSSTRSSFRPNEIELIWKICDQLAKVLDRILLISKLEKKNEELMETNKKLLTSEARFFNLFHKNPTPMVIIDEVGTIMDVNDAFLTCFGCQRIQIEEQKIKECELWVDSNQRTDVKNKVAITGGVLNEEIRFLTVNGETRVGLLSVQKVELGQEQCFLSIIQDITDYKSYENQLARLDQLNLVGEMAAGIAHEVRNPMTTVRGFIQLLSSNKSYSNDKPHFDLMLNELDRANSIITEFLSLAKDTMVHLKKENINSIIEKILPLLDADAMVSDKSVQTKLENTPLLLLDEQKIRQLILNLARNGLESMTEGGVLTIHTYMEDEALVLSIMDQGKGIHPEILEDIWKPFVTTKENGTGLGLSICYSIANRHNAKIEVQSVSTGTTFLVKFNLST